MQESRGRNPIRTSFGLTEHKNRLLCGHRIVAEGKVARYGSEPQGEGSATGRRVTAFLAKCMFDKEES